MCALHVQATDYDNRAKIDITFTQSETVNGITIGYGGGYNAASGVIAVPYNVQVYAGITLVYDGSDLRAGRSQDVMGGLSAVGSELTIYMWGREYDTFEINEILFDTPAEASYSLVGDGYCAGHDDKADPPVTAHGVGQHQGETIFGSPKILFPEAPITQDPAPPDPGHPRSSSPRSHSPKTLHAQLHALHCCAPPTCAPETG